MTNNETSLRPTRAALRALVGTAALALVLAVSACGSDEDTSSISSTTVAVDNTTSTTEGATTDSTVAETATSGASPESTATTGMDDGASTTGTVGSMSGQDACDLITPEEFKAAANIDVTATPAPEGGPICDYTEVGGELIAKLNLTEGMAATMAVSQANPSEASKVDGIGEELVVSSTGRQANMRVGEQGYTLTQWSINRLTADNLTELMRQIVAG